MPRYTKILLGPTRKNDPQVWEAPADVSTLPGTFVTVNAGGEFVPAGAAPTDLVRIVQENYLALRGVDVAYGVGDRMIGIEMQPDVLYAGRVAAGQNIARIGAPLTTNAAGHLINAGAGVRVVAYADEVYNNNTGTTQLVSIRPA